MSRLVSMEPRWALVCAALVSATNGHVIPVLPNLGGNPSYRILTTRIVNSDINGSAAVSIGTSASPALFLGPQAVATSGTTVMTHTVARHASVNEVIATLSGNATAINGTLIVQVEYLIDMN